MKVSFIANFYNSEPNVRRLVADFRKLQEWDADFFEFILVDDHSSDPLDPAIFEGVANLRVIRIRDDIAWNQPGARNVGAKLARTKLLMMADIDHGFAFDELDRLRALCEDFPKRHRLIFPRWMTDANGGRAPYKPNINCFIMRKPDFMAVGGYDERFSGNYSKDDSFFRFCCKRAGIREEICDFHLVIGGTAATKGLDRNRDINTRLFDDSVEAGITTPQIAFKCKYDVVHDSTVAV